MKKIYRIVNYFILVILFFSLFLAVPKSIYSATTQTATYDTSLKPLIDLLNILFGGGAPTTNQPQLNISPTGTSSPGASITPFVSLTPTQTGLGGFTYYPQCNGNFDNYPLQFGCNICQAGCGIATTSMILSSFVDQKFTPPAVEEIYKQTYNLYDQMKDPQLNSLKKYFATGCDGSSIGGAQTILKQNGVRTSDIQIYSSNDEALADFKNYLNAGWTMYVLGRYCDGGCDHFFWVTQVDANNNVWAYDSYYGRFQVAPFDENLYYPFPQYRMAFPVKKQ